MKWNLDSSFFYVREPPIHFCAAWWLTWFLFFSCLYIVVLCALRVFFSLSVCLTLSPSLFVLVCFLFYDFGFCRFEKKCARKSHTQRALNIQTKCLNIPQLKICNNTTICARMPFGLFSIVWLCECVCVCAYLRTHHACTFYRTYIFFLCIFHLELVNISVSMQKTHLKYT